MMIILIIIIKEIYKFIKRKIAQCHKCAKSAVTE